MMLRFFIACQLVFLALCFGANAQTIPDGKNARVVLISEAEQVAPGETVFLGLQFDMREHWHIYWRNPGDSGLSPEIIWSETVDQTALGEFLWPVPREYLVLEDEIMDYGYSGKVVFPFSVTIPETANGQFTVSGVADYLICERVCLPEEQDIAISLPVTERVIPNLENAAIINEWLAQTPTDLQGEAVYTEQDGDIVLSIASETLALQNAANLRFFPLGYVIKNVAPQIGRVGDAGASLILEVDRNGPDGEALEGVLVATATDGSRTGFTLVAEAGDLIPNTDSRALITPSAKGALLYILGLAFLGGLILNLMPCVLPVLSFKTFGLMAAAASGKANESRLHGIAYTFGVLVCFAALGLLLLTMRASFGVASWGQWMQYAPVVAAIVLILFVIGLWMFGLLEWGTSAQNFGADYADSGGVSGAFFTGLLAAVVGAPCTAPFLGPAIGLAIDKPAPVLILIFLVIGLGLAFPFLLLSFVPGLARLLPKPGAWMNVFKQALAFPMFLAAAWFMVTLGQLAGPRAVAWTVAGVIIILFAIWLARLRPQAGAFKAIALLIALIGAGYAVWVSHSAQNNGEAGGVAIATSTDFKTMAWSREAVAAEVAAGNPVFIDFTATWCATCQLNKRTTLQTAAVEAAFAATNTTFMIADFTSPNAEISAELQRHSRAGVPMYLYYPAGDPNAIVLPELLTPALVISYLEDGA